MSISLNSSISSVLTSFLSSSKLSHIKRVKMNPSKKKFIADGWGTRHTFSLMGFLGFVLAYAMRFNLSIAIVQMVHQPKQTADGLTASVCPHHNDLNLNESATSAVALARSSEFELESSSKFNWTEEEQGMILGSFFWGYVLTQYAGGKLAHMYGAKWIFSSGLLLTATLSISLPSVTLAWGKGGLLAVRILMGVTEGVMFPSMHVMLAHWSPPEERSRLTNMIFSGIPLGTAMTMISGGYLMHFFGWPALFYAAGACTFIWFIFWSFLVYDYPSEHPRISQDELSVIESSIQGQTNKEHIATPWKEVLKSAPIWGILIIHIGHTWGHYLLHAEVPKYLHSVHNFHIQHNGWFSALPQLLNCAVALLMSQLSDFLIVKGLTSILFTRKMCATLAVWGSAAAFLGIALGGCNTLVAVVCLNLAGAAMGSGFGGWVVNVIDIAPNHAGSIMGVANSISNCFGFLAPYVSGVILNNNSSLNGWRLVFLIPALVNFFCNIIYLIFAKAEEMPWNRPKPKNEAISLY